MRRTQPHCELDRVAGPVQSKKTKDKRGRAQNEPLMTAGAEKGSLWDKLGKRKIGKIDSK